jgi:hypothetical protein
MLQLPLSPRTRAPWPLLVLYFLKSPSLTLVALRHAMQMPRMARMRCREAVFLRMFAKNAAYYEAVQKGNCCVPMKRSRRETAVFL